MARAHYVKSARKPNAERKAAGIKQGQPYYWWAFMVGGRGGRKHYSLTPPKASQLTQSDFLGQFYALEESIGELVGDDGLADSVSDIAQQFRDLGDEQESKKENLPDSLQDGPSGELLQQRKDRCDEIADELEGLDLSVPDAAEDDDDDDDSTPDEKEGNGPAAKVDGWADKLDEVQNVDLSVE